MLFVGDDWAEDHHDVEIVDDTGQVLARRRLPEGLDGVTRLHALIGEHTPAEWADLEPDRAAAMVKVGIETDRGTLGRGVGRDRIRGVRRDIRPTPQQHLCPRKPRRRWRFCVSALTNVLICRTARAPAYVVPNRAGCLSSRESWSRLGRRLGWSR